MGLLDGMDDLLCSEGGPFEDLEDRGAINDYRRGNHCRRLELARKNWTGCENNDGTGSRSWRHETLYSALDPSSKMLYPVKSGLRIQCGSVSFRNISKRCAMGSITSPSPRPLQLQHRFTISKQHISVVCRAEPPAQKDKQEEPVYLSDFMKFESELPKDALDESTGDKEELVDRATKVLDNARTLLSTFGDSPTSEEDTKASSDTGPSSAVQSMPSLSSDLPSVPPTVEPKAEKETSPPQEVPKSTSPAAKDNQDDERTREVLRGALNKLASTEARSRVSMSSLPENPWDNPKWEPSPWENEPENTGLTPQLEEKKENAPSLPVLEKQDPVTLTLTSQITSDILASKTKNLPPLQSVVELTSAFEPPTRGGTTTMETGAGMALEDGSGTLSDGSTWERKSGEERGENGYWKRWTMLQGTTPGGKVEWQETWWEVSDWNGLREYGALKEGTGAGGGSWRETWTEKVYTDSVKGARCVDRFANKWASAAGGDEWEEKWDEHYSQNGQVIKSANKWAKEGSQVWHERWGEDYNGSGGCVKWTDKWAEALTEGGGKVEWGDKWEENFSHGKGSKTGETWNIGHDGFRHQKWWGENHFGDGHVQKYGNSTSGDSWDVTERMDTYYNPIPHFGYKHAILHSPRLVDIPTLPKDDVDGELSHGLGAL